MGYEEYRLTLKRGPYLLYLPGEMDGMFNHEMPGEEIAVTRMVHQFLFEDVLVRPDVQLSDLLTLGRDNAAFHAVFRRYGSRRTVHVVEQAITAGTIQSSSEVEYLKIAPKDGFVDLVPMGFANSDGSRAVHEWDSFNLLTLLSMRLKMSEREEEKDDLLAVPAKKVAHLVRLGELLRTAYLMARHDIDELDSNRRFASETWEPESEELLYDDGGGLAADPNYNHDNGPDPW